MLVLRDFGKKTIWLDSLILLVLTAVLVKPLFRREYIDNWKSIESTFIADARMLSENLPHPGWQPLWYCGTRFDYIYPPALRYGTALISKITRESAARAYHLYTGILYSFGIVAVYWLVRAGSGSRGGALIAAAATALISPSFLLLSDMRHDSAYLEPQRIHVLASYGEGPHISALSILAAALAAAFLALRRWHAGYFALTAFLCALTVAHNFYGATALAIFFPILVWSVWVSEPSYAVWLRTAGVIALSYGLCAIWLTPSYLRITVMNLAWVSQPGNVWSKISAAIVVLLLCSLSYRLARRRLDRAWSVFVFCSGAIVSLWVLGFFYFGFRVAGEPNRLVPELDLALTLVGVELLRRLWTRHRRIATLLALLAFCPAVIYLRHASFLFPRAGPLSDQPEYRITKWVNDNLPGQRVFASGSIRFWYNAWFDNVQAGGGSEQGMLNQNLPHGIYQITAGHRPYISMLWLQALGVDAIIVPGLASAERFHDFVEPEKFQAAFPVLYDDQQGTIIYRVPRSFPGIGRVIDPVKLAAAGKIGGGDDITALSHYVAVIDDNVQNSATVSRRGLDSFDIQATVSRGQAILVQETYDPAWRAYEDGHTLSIRSEPALNFMIIDVPEGRHHVQMRFETPLENRVGQFVTAFSILFAIGLVWRGWRR